MKIDISDKIEIKEDLKNHKPWFNGMKVFSSVKINPPQVPPDVLEINVSDGIMTESGLIK